MENIIRRRCGAIALADGSVTWKVWAPRAKQVDLALINGTVRRTARMQIGDDEEFFHAEPSVSDGQLYAFRLEGGEERADPCSLWQPQGVSGPSAIVRTDLFQWTDSLWRGVHRQDLVFYELHVGAFTGEGTFEAVIPRLHTLRELGITAIEIMPIAQFPGTRNWGYDGVLPYAAQNSYGGPNGFQKLVDACHAAGLAIFLDVVYNHLGPESNFLHEFGPYFTDRYKTPWGQAVNYDGPGSDRVRDWVLDNARMWLEEFHVDGLRLDAVHAIYDMGARHILQAVEDVAHDVSLRTGVLRHIVAESDLNDPRIIKPAERGGYGLDAQWSDDFHHAVHGLLTGEKNGYYQDFGRADQLAKVMNSPFLFAGDYCRSRGRKHGAPPEGLPGDRFVVCIQNHDQVGNRAVGDRFGTLLEPAKHRLAATLMLFSPYLPLLFMGEEYGETRPFPFFCSFGGDELVRAVRDGRRREFADFVADPRQVPDPGALDTFTSAKLSWSWPAGSQQAGIRALYRDLLAARKQWPAMKDSCHRTASIVRGREGSEALELVRGGGSEQMAVYFNLSHLPQRVTIRDAGNLVPLFCSESNRYHGRRPGSHGDDRLLPFECIAFGPPQWPDFCDMKS